MGEVGERGGSRQACSRCGIGGLQVRVCEIKEVGDANTRFTYIMTSRSKVSLDRLSHTKPHQNSVLEV